MMILPNRAITPAPPTAALPRVRGGSWTTAVCVRQAGPSLLDDWSTKRTMRISTFYYAITQEEWEKDERVAQQEVRPQATSYLGK